MAFFAVECSKNGGKGVKIAPQALFFTTRAAEKMEVDQRKITPQVKTGIRVREFK